MADNLNGQYSDTDTNTIGPLRFKDIGGVFYAVSILANSSGTLIDTMPVSAASLPLPSGASTSAKQDTAAAILTTMDADTGAIATSVASLDGKAPALGQALAAASVPVVLTAIQVAALTPPAAITGFATAANQTTELTSLSTISSSLTSIDGHVDGVESSLTSIDAKITAVNTGAVVVASSALPTGAATAARQDTGNTSLSSIDGKVTACNTGAVVLAAGTAAFGKLAANSGVTIGAVEIASAQTLATVTTVGTVTTVTTCSTVTTLTGSGIAHDAVDSGNGHKLALKASTSLSGLTLVSNADRTDLYAGVDGVQIIRPHCNLEDIVSGVAAITDGSSTSVIAAAGSGVKVYITSIVIANSSATAVTVDIRDGAAGTVKATYPVPANTAGVVHTLNVPLPFSANTAVCADPSASATTVTVTLIGFKSKI
jgi:hypothetical protein